MSQGMWVALEAECDPRSTTSKEMRTQSYYHLGLDSANNLNEPGSIFSPGASSKEYSCAHALILAL